MSSLGHQIEKYLQEKIPGCTVKFYECRFKKDGHLALQVVVTNAFLEEEFYSKVVHPELLRMANVLQFECWSLDQSDTGTQIVFRHLYNKELGLMS